MPIIPGNLGMGQNIADASRVEDQRFLNSFMDPFASRQVGTGNDLGWDALFGALQRTGQDAADAGMKFNVKLGGAGNIAPSLAALRRR